MELGTMQRFRTSYEIAQFSISKPLELASMTDKVFWDLTEDGKYSNRLQYRSVKTFLRRSH
ncbi:hypothetical protein H5410_053613 [Solanum commersonii]|uniref:Uncharacterized protein n=1 Tax=Solanum commersonii TaxID=4109 RepID=A0A9J5X505_SOLCO|nr:hypothetical protein H5410_053613 [Solanum commersonii]